MLTSDLAVLSISSLQFICVAGLHILRQVCSFSLRSAKLAQSILQKGKVVAHDIEGSREMMMRRWSALGGWMLGLMLQEMIGFEGLLAPDIIRSCPVTEHHFKCRDT